MTQGPANRTLFSKGACARGLAAKLPGARKSILTALVMVLLFAGPAAKIFAAQDDFYGTWVLAMVESGGIGVIKLDISASTVRFESSYMPKDWDDQSREIEWEIISWFETANQDPDTWGDFPEGVIMRIKNSDDSALAWPLYISRDKKRVYTEHFPDGETLTYTSTPLLLMK
jgi:hypothetical protein